MNKLISQSELCGKAVSTEFILIKEVFSVEEAAEYLKIPVKSVEYYSKRKGELSYIPLGKNIVFRKSDLDEFLANRVRQGLI